MRVNQKLMSSLIPLVGKIPYTAPMFDPVDPKQSFPALEKGILEYWRDEDMFRRSIAMREGSERFSFYDGPPFATGLPHYGHLLAGTIKDVIPRYQTMRGKQVQRRFGWDCHGLPIENLIEKEHDIKSKQDIEAMGVRQFNDLCRSSVQRYAKEWRTTVERMGRWVDMDWDYRTMDATYMESIWWVCKSLADRELLYEGHKPMHICPRCATPLSNFEVTQGYKDVTDVSAVVMFRLEESEDSEESGESEETYVLAWTTTPWTLPGNLFVAIGSKIKYVQVKSDGKIFIVAKDRVKDVFKERVYEIIKDVKVSDLRGKKYTPLFPYFVDDYKKDAFHIVTGDFVSTEDGTGLVHIAPGFGEDDFAIGKKEKVKLLQHVTMEGKFLEAVSDFAGQEVKPIDDPSKTDRKVVEWLEKHGKLFAQESYRHSYPHCWRCDSPLLNYATSSWFVRVEDIKQDMLDANAKTQWVPAHLRDGRFGNWLENARDWAISRNRYWGTPLPIWRDSSSGDMDVIGSRDDLMNHNLIRYTKVTAIRHGEAEHNVGHFYQSAVPGVDLTTTGKKQAKAAGEYLSVQNVNVIYCSPLARTQQTARAIADATGADVIVDERLREVECGPMEGKAIDSSDLTMLKLRRQKKLQEHAPESLYHVEGMEKYESIRARITEFFEEVLPRHRGDHIVVVTHADPIMNMRHFFTKEDPFKLSHQAFPNYATPEQYFWDHDRCEQMDLHKENVDEVTWPNAGSKTFVDATFVRHGETDWNKERKVQGGNADIPLNDTGRAQAQKTAESLKKKKFDVIVCSDLKRAAETAAILGKELGLNIETSELLRERDAGSWSGESLDTIFDRLNSEQKEMSLAFHYATPEGGESFSAFMIRMKRAYNMLLEQYAGKRILVVAHRGVVLGFNALSKNTGYWETATTSVHNGAAMEMKLHSLMKRIPDVLDCWFESGSMPYAQQHYPFEMAHAGLSQSSKSGRGAAGASSSDAHLSHRIDILPPNFPADFIAEGIDQTRGWFYTLTVLAAALYKEPAFIHNIVNGIVLAEDGRKMSKKLKNYPEPNGLIEQFGADALRFTLMRSPAVRAEDLRFSERAVEETVRSMLLPLWNSYSFFVTYANLAAFTPSARPNPSKHPLDRWIKAEVQDLVNRMTEQLDTYDLSATCEELFETIDALTNWYIRLSRRRFAGKGSMHENAGAENFEADQTDALTTLYDVLLTVSQLLAPFCPFVTEAIYLNLVDGNNTSIHLTDWPQVRVLTKEEQQLLQRQRLLRQIVSLGLKIRSDAKVRARAPLASAHIAFPPTLLGVNTLSEDDVRLIQQELNVKTVVIADDPGRLGERYAQVDARKVGPRLGKRVQEVIQAGKRGEFEELPNGEVVILEETLAPDEVAILYRGKEGENIAAERGVVVSIDTTLTEELKMEGLARDLIRGIQQLRKDAGLSVQDRIRLQVDDMDDVLKAHGELIAQETNAVLSSTNAEAKRIIVDDREVTIHFERIA